MDISVYDAKTHLSRILNDVEAGSEVTITRHGRPVARIVPVRARDEREARAVRAIAEFRALRDEIDDPPTTEELVAWIRESREGRS